MKYFMIPKALILLAPVMAANLTADALVLRDGRRVDGRLISVQNGLVEFEDARALGAANVVRFNQADVLSITFDGNGTRAAAFPGTLVPQGRPSGLRERQISVSSTVRAVDTGIDLQMGQEVYFEAAGEVRWRANRNDGPGGESNSPANPNRPIPNRPAGALIGRVGNTDYFFIGNDRGAIRMRGSGRLFLAVNDDNLADNSGEFRVIVYY